LGLKSAVVTRIGDDVAGQAVLKDLQIAKVSKSLVNIDPRVQTAYQLVIENEDGEREIISYPGASGEFNISDLPLSKFKCKWLYISNIGSQELLERVIKSAVKKKIKIALNIDSADLKMGFRGLLPLMRYLDLMVLNLENAAALTQYDHDDVGVIVDAMSVSTPGVIAIIDGTRAAYASPSITEEETLYMVPLVPNGPPLTTGIEDVFGASLLAGLLKSDNDAVTALKIAYLNVIDALREDKLLAVQTKRWPSKQQLDKIRVSKL